MSTLLNDALVGRVRAAAARSEFLRAVASVRLDGGRRLALGDASLGPLSPEEIARLERGGSAADDWSKVLVAEGFDPGRVRNSSFHGEVVLGRFAGRACPDGGPELPAGVYNSTVADCV